MRYNIKRRLEMLQQSLVVYSYHVIFYICLRFSFSIYNLIQIIFKVVSLKVVFD